MDEIKYLMMLSDYWDYQIYINKKGKVELWFGDQKITTRKNIQTATKFINSTTKEAERLEWQ